MVQFFLWEGRLTWNSDSVFKPKGVAEQLTVDGVHDLKRTIRILVLEAFKDKVHEGCYPFSYRRSE